MRFQGHNLTKMVFALALLTVVLMSAAGLPHFGMTMNMDEHGNMAMSDCYMPGMTTLCNMNALDHIGWWQSMFTSIPSQNVMLALLLLVLGVVLFVWLKQGLSPPLQLQTLSKFRERDYIPLSTSLQELFSNGILHSKTY